jgi:hypothetical protein
MAAMSQKNTVLENVGSNPTVAARLQPSSQKRCVTMVNLQTSVENVIDGGE